MRPLDKRHHGKVQDTDKIKLMKSIISTFKALPKGISRLIYSMGLVLPTIITLILYSNASYLEEDEVLFGSMFFSFFGYWFLVILGLWIYQGFKEDRTKK